MTSRKLLAETEAREARPVSARVVARKEFRFHDHATDTQVVVQPGDMLMAARLRDSGCDVAKLIRTGFVRREDE